MSTFKTDCQCYLKLDIVTCNMLIYPNCDVTHELKRLPGSVSHWHQKVPCASTWDAEGCDKDAGIWWLGMRTDCASCVIAHHKPFDWICGNILNVHSRSCSPSFWPFWPADTQTCPQHQEWASLLNLIVDSRPFVNVWFWLRQEKHCWVLSGVTWVHYKLLWIVVGFEILALMAHQGQVLSIIFLLQ